MKRLMTTFASSAIAASILFTGCGSEEDEKVKEALSTYTNEMGETVTAVQVSVSGVVADGYLENAHVCLDTNKNKKCDTGEPNADTAADGSYTLTGAKTGFESYPVLVEVIAGVTKDADDGGAAIAKPYILVAPAGIPATGEKKVVSPLTTLVQAKIETSGLSQDAAEILVSQDMGITYGSVDLMADYVEMSASTDTAVAASYQNIHQVAKIVAEQIAVAIDSVAKANPGTSIDDKMGVIFSAKMADISDQTNLQAVYKVAENTDDTNLSGVLESGSAILDDFASTADEAEFLVNTEIASADDKTLFQTWLTNGAYGIYIEEDNGILYPVAEEITYNETNGTLDFVRESFDFLTSTWSVPADSNDTRTRIYYEVDGTTGAFTERNETEGGPSSIPVKFNTNGSLSIEHDGMIETVAVGEKLTLGGKSLAMLMPNDLDPVVRAGITGVFTEGAIAIRLVFNREMGATPYRIGMWNDYECNEFGCNEVDGTELYGNRLRFWDDSGDHNVTSIADMKLKFEDNGSNNNMLWVSNIDTPEGRVEYQAQFASAGSLSIYKRQYDPYAPVDWNGDGIIDAYGQDVTTKLQDAGTYTQSKVGDKDIIVLNIPSQYKDGWEQYTERFYIVDNVTIPGQVVVRQGQRELGGEQSGKQDDFVLNDIAYNDLKNAISSYDWSAYAAAISAAQSSGGDVQMDWAALFDPATQATQFAADFNATIVLDFGNEKNESGTEFHSEARIALDVVGGTATLRYEKFNVTDGVLVEGAELPVTYAANLDNSYSINVTVPQDGGGDEIIKFYRVGPGLMFMHNETNGEKHFVPFFVDFWATAN